jgi:SIR2-like domain
VRFTANGPNIPDDLLNARDDGNVVFLCGAGISATVNLPNFKDLTETTMDWLNVEPGSDAYLAFKPWADADDPEIPDTQKVPENARPSFDLIFNTLQQAYGRDRVGRLVADQLSAHRTRTEPSKAHQIIARLSADQSGNPQIVTTNFDRLFEHPDVIDNPRWYEPPTFPDLRHNRPITGITYLHGRLSDQPEGQHDYVLSSADFGRAYLAEAWATRFIRMMLEKYTVVLLGYSANDPPVRYLLQGLNSSAMSGNRRLFAFDRGDPGEIEAKWRDRGVIPIAYDEHADLWKSLEGWATRADDPAAWRASVLGMAQTPPSDLASYQRGQVAHIVRSAIGAKEFADSVPPAPVDWICVFDRSCRTGEKFEASAWDRDAELFDPQVAYGLDDDPPRSKEKDQNPVLLADDLVAWRTGDQRPTDQFRLGGRRTRGFEDMPARLFHIARWISTNADKPTIAWWAARQAGVHPRLLEMIARRIENSDTMPDIAHRVWDVIFQYLDRDDFGPGDMQWFRARRKITRAGWTSETLQYFKNSIEPIFERDHLMGVERVKPPSGDWADIPLRSLVPFSVKFRSHHNDKPDVSDDAVVHVLGAMNQALTNGVHRLDQIGDRWLICPSPYPEDEDDEDTDRYVPETGKFVTWYYDLFNRAAILAPEQTRGLVNLWPTNEPKVFDKLRLFAWNKPSLFDADYAADRILALDQRTFWNPYHRRELVHLLRDRWDSFDLKRRVLLENRIIAGRDRLDHDPDEKQFIIRRSDRSAAILTWLVNQGCALSDAATDALAGLKTQVPGWKDDWAEHADSEAIRTGKVGYVVVNKDAAVFEGVPVEEIVQVAIAHTRRPLGELTEYLPFSGLVSNEPCRALAALTSAAATGEYPVDLWKTLIADWPDSTNAADHSLFHAALKHLPASVIVDLRHYVGPWMQDKLPLVAASDQPSALSIFDALLDGLLTGGDAASESDLIDTAVADGTVEASRRTLDHAINSSVGHATIAWVKMLEAQKPDAGSELPIEYSSRVERLLTAPGEGSDHAISILGWHLNWLDWIAPTWVGSRLIPCLAPEHPAAEPLWSGVFGLRQIPRPELFGAMKQPLLGLFPRLYDWGWESSRYEPAHDWLVLACLEHVRDAAYVSYDEAISSIRKFTPEGRTHAIYFLGQFGRGKDDGWVKAVIPFIRQAWPPEVRYQVESTSAAFLSLLDDSGDSFPDLYAAIRPYLRPISGSVHGLYGFYRLVGDTKEPVTAKYPDLVLDMVNLVTPEDARSLPYDFADALAAIVEAQPDLVRDPRYIRLARLAADR